MVSRKNAAIILLGMGETAAAEILKTLSHKEVEVIIEIMNNMDDVSEQDVIKALNEFFKEAHHTSGLHTASSDYIRNSLVTAVGTDKAGSLMDEGSFGSALEGFELLKWQPLYVIVDALREEHPQIITVALMYLESDKAAEVLKWLPKDISKNVIKRMSHCSPVSQFALRVLSDYFVEQFTKPEKFKMLTADGVNMAANIVSRLDMETEHEIISFIKTEDEALSGKLEDRLFPFEKLAELDARSLRTLLVEIDNKDFVLALKAADDQLKAVFFKNMSLKNVELLKEDLESLGPVKLSDVLIAQKKIIELAKQLSENGKITLPTLKQDGTIY